MNKKKDKMVSSRNPGFHQMTLREEITGRKQFNGGAGSSNLKSILKMQHYQNLSSWAGGEALHSLAALYGQHLASCQEASGTARDPSLFQCQRCESVLQPGYNCSVRIKTHGSKTRRRKKLNIPMENNVVYTCHFCSHQNMIRGTPKGYVKQLVASKTKTVVGLVPKCSTDQASASSDKSMISSKEEISKKAEEMVSSEDVAVLKSKSSEVDQNLAKVIPTVDKSQERMQTVLLSGDKGRKSRGSGAEISAKPEERTTNLDTGSGGSRRKRRKSWSSLREIAENSERENKHHISNLTIPFFL